MVCLKARLHRRFLSRHELMQFLSRLRCNFKIARVNQVRFSVRFVTAISQGFRTCLKLDAILLLQKLHRLAATKITCVNGPLSSLSLMSRKPFLRALRALCIFAGYGLDTHLSRISSRITVRMLCYFLFFSNKWPYCKLGIRRNE